MSSTKVMDTLLCLFAILAFIAAVVECRALEYKNATKRLPQAIIIGAKKCGTRALLKFIGAHPNVTTAGAETHFFDRFYHMGLDWYREQMPESMSDQITIEKTPKYLVDKRVPGRVYQMNPDLKLIVVLRDPVVRAVSEYVQSQWRRRQLSSLSLAARSVRGADDAKHVNDSVRFEHMAFQTFRHNHRRTRRSIRADWPIIRNGMYATHLRAWLERFPRSQFLFVNGERLISSPSDELNRVEHFLGLRSVLRPQHFVRDRRRKQGGFACIIKPLDSKQIKCLSEQKGRPHPTIDKRVIDELRAFYRPFNKQLFEMIGEREPWWEI